jgi:ribosomal protein S18 acetylase RimI-like enzyme
MNSLSVEPFAADADAAVAALLRDHAWSAGQIRGQLEALRSLAASEDGVALIATLDGALAGFISLQIHRWNGLAQIHGLAVGSDLLRRGCATRLVAAVEAVARDRGCRGIYADTPVTNASARAFYVARGYSEDYRMSRYYADDLDGVTYVKFFSTDVADVAA